MEGNRDLLMKLVDIFRGEYPRLLAALRQSVETGDAKGVEETAHAIRGMVGNFGARSTSEAAAALEDMGREGRPRRSRGPRRPAGARRRSSRQGTSPA